MHRIFRTHGNFGSVLPVRFFAASGMVARYQGVPNNGDLRCWAQQQRQVVHSRPRLRTMELSDWLTLVFSLLGVFADAGVSWMFFRTQLIADFRSQKEKLIEL